LIIPTFIGITLIVFVITQLVPGGPIERQILKYKMAMSGEGGAAAGGFSGGGNEIPPSAMEAMKKFYEGMLGRGERPAGPAG